MEEKFEMELENGIEIKLYKMRWVVIGVFTLYAAASAVQWVEYSIITNIVMKYYGVTSIAVDWTSMIAMAAYPVLILPGSYMINKTGLRFCALFGAIGTALGAWIKIFSVRPHLFWVGFLGQTVVFSNQIFILSLPPKIASVWFGPNEISTACSIGIFGTQLGTALSFILPPLIVKKHDDLEDIGRDLSYLFYAVAIFCTISAILIFFLFKSQPPSPPSNLQAEIRSRNVEFSNAEFWREYKQLMVNKDFLLLTVSFGIGTGVYVSLCTMLNQFVLEYFRNGEKDAGMIGLLLVVVGMIGLIIFGIVLDKTKKYKQTTLALYGMTILAVIAFMVSLETYNKILVYITGCILGFFQTAYYGVAFEFGVELSYPVPENTSSGVLVSMAQIFGIGFTSLLGQLLTRFGTFWALISMIAFLTVGGILTLVTPNKLMRQEALKTNAENKTFMSRIDDKRSDFG